MYVDVRINGSARAHLRLDTGADGTVIAPRVLEAAGAIRRPRTTVVLRGVTHDGGDGGPHKCQYPGRDPCDAVAAHEIEMVEGDGLLGRDFLDQFNWSVDNVAGRVTLSTK